jgi:glycosyltransferase involved in cell wall biosynthesis
MAPTSDVPAASSCVFVVPGRLETVTGGYEYDRRIIEGLRGLGWSVAVVELDESFPLPTRDALVHAASELATIDDGAIVVIDGLALGAMPDEAGREAARLRIVALLHHPLAVERGLNEATAAALRESERRALAAARRVIVTSPATAASLWAYDVALEKILVIEPGTDRAPVSRGSGSSTVELVSVATLIPRKGHDVLFQALASISSGPWHLTCVGSLERDPATVATLKGQLVTLGLADRVSFAGEQHSPALERFYDRADVFVLPTFHEGYGMAVAEAVARGLPVVSTRTGGIPDLVGEEGGILVEPGDADALAAALGRVIGDPQLRQRLATGARRKRTRLPTWQDAASAMARVLGSRV